MGNASNIKLTMFDVYHADQLLTGSSHTDIGSRAQAVLVNHASHLKESQKVQCCNKADYHVDHEICCDFDASRPAPNLFDRGDAL
jgi:hypothetical protein